METIHPKENDERFHFNRVSPSLCFVCIKMFERANVPKEMRTILNKGKTSLFFFFSTLCVELPIFLLNIDQRMLTANERCFENWNSTKAIENKRNLRMREIERLSERKEMFRMGYKIE